MLRPSSLSLKRATWKCPEFDARSARGFYSTPITPCRHNLRRPLYVDLIDFGVGRTLVMGFQQSDAVVGANIAAIEVNTRSITGRRKDLIEARETIGASRQWHFLRALQLLAPRNSTRISPRL